MKNWNWYAVQPVAGNFIVMGDYLYFCEWSYNDRCYCHSAIVLASSPIFSVFIVFVTPRPICVQM